MHYGSCRKNRKRAASLSPSHRPPALSFPSLQPSLRLQRPLLKEAFYVLRAEASLTSITFLDHEKC